MCSNPVGTTMNPEDEEDEREVELRREEPTPAAEETMAAEVAAVPSKPRGGVTNQRYVRSTSNAPTALGWYSYGFAYAPLPEVRLWHVRGSFSYSYTRQCRKICCDVAKTQRARKVARFPRNRKICFSAWRP